MTFNLFQRNQPTQPQQAVQQPVVLQPAQATQMPVVDRNSPTSGMDAISSMLTSPEQEEKMRRASVANQRILAVADALRHIGNIAHTVKYAPSQQFNSPVQEEQARYEKGKAVRDAANMRYYSYQQAKEAQEQKQRELDRNFEANQRYRAAQLQNRKQELDRLDKQYELNERKAAWQRQYQQGTLDIKKELQKLNEEYKRGMLSVAQYRAATYALNSSGGGRGGKGMDEYTVTSRTQYDIDPNTGEKRGSTTTKTRTVNRKDGSSQTTTTTKKKQLPGQGSSKPQHGKKKLP